MNKLLLTISSAFLVMAGLCLPSCSDNEDIKPTGIDGCPSALISKGQVMTSFIYTGNRFDRIQYPDGRAVHFNYENGELSGISYTPPKNVADGHAWTYFTKTSNKTYEVSRCAEPSGDFDYREKIELDTNGLPFKVTFTGIYQQTADGKKQIKEGDRYALLSFDPVTRQLSELKVFDNESNLLVKITYEYDNASGSFSHLEFPLWFLGWRYYQNVYSNDFEDIQFLNHRNNITKITSENREGNISTVTYTYKYNDNDFPVSVFCDEWEDTEIGIRY